MKPAFLREALDLARRGRGQTSPNPMVGAVLVREGEVVGRGFHTYGGMKHAEVHALEEAGPLACGATLYVNLEPCSHQGRTGPCADALIAAGISRVVAAMNDPNPQVTGEGFRKLRTAGIEPVAEAFYRDHHAYSEQDIRDLLDLRQRSEADGFVTTEKDAVNLGGYLAALAPLAVVPVKMELTDAANAVDTILARIAERSRQP